MFRNTRANSYTDDRAIIPRNAKQQLFSQLRAVIWLTLVYAAVSVLFSLLTWGQTSKGAYGLPSLYALAIDLALHFLSGLIIAAPSGQWTLVLLGGATAVAVDFDHVGPILGLPVVGRASHSLIFMALSGLCLALIARGQSLSKSASSLLWAAIGMGVVISHLSVDAMLGDGDFPLLTPFSSSSFDISRLFGLLLQIMAVALVAFARYKSNAKTEVKAK